MASSTTQTVTPQKQQQQDSSSSSSSSKRHFHWTNKVGTELDDPEQQPPPCLLKSSSSSAARPPPEKKKTTTGEVSERRKKLPQVAVARLRSVVLSALGRTISRDRGSSSLGSRVVGTLFGSRRGHVHFAFQKSPASQPTFLIELATPISGLVKEMASGLVRIALECDKRKKNDTGKKTTTTTSFPLLEENTWRTYCNGKKSGFATRRDCGPHDWKILKAVEPISMGAGVLPPLNDNDDKNDKNSSEDDVMYMRAKFERIVGSRDSEAFYMMNPDSNGAPELSIYLLRL